jgi:hypothetical protein
MMQWLGLLAIVIPLWNSSKVHNSTWFWILTFVSLSFVCSILAIPLYLYVPTEWSSWLAFAGSAMQTCTVVYAVSLIDKHGKEKME